MQSNYDIFNALQNQHNQKNERSVENFFKAIFRKKHYIVITILLALAVAYFINYSATPLYESKTLLKKDNTVSSKGDEFQEIMNLQTKDLIETEIQLVTTNNVLNNVVNDLKLYLNIDKIVDKSGHEIDINKSLVDYNHEYLENNPEGNSYPHFLEIKALTNNPGSSVMIKKVSAKTFDFYNADDGAFLGRSNVDGAITYKTPTLDLVLYWPSSSIGDKLYITIKSYAATIGGLKSSITVSQIDNTNIFSISATSSSPYLAQKVVNSISNNFISSRVEQQRQAIKYSFNFADQQLQDISGKLKTAEQNLSQYKSSHQIMTMGEKSSNLVNFLSTLEAEKVQTQLQLGDYENKATEMEKEYKQNGTFDQTFLSPEKTSSTMSPFSTLQDQLSRLELQRIELLKKRNPEHPDVVNIDNQIAQLKDKMKDYNQNTLTAYKIIISAAKKKEDALSKLTNKYQGLIQQLPPQESKLAELMREKNVYEKVFNLLLNKREEMRIAELSKLQDIFVVEPAVYAGNIIYPKKNLNYTLALIMGVFVGLFFVWVTERSNKRLSDLTEIEEELKLPIMAIIPNYTNKLGRQISNSKVYDERFVVMMDEHEKYKESFNLLKLKIAYTLKEIPKLIMFTSCEEHTGKTTIIANFAIMLAQSGKKVLLIDCDLKRGRLSEVFDVPEGSAGLLNYLLNEEVGTFTYNILKNKEKDRTVRTLDIIPAGGIYKRSSDLLASERMEKLLKILRDSSYDYVLFDTPPITRIVDGLIIGQYIKNTVLIIRPDFSFKDSVLWGVKEMEEYNLNVLGTVVNACEIEKSVFKYKYGYGYEYHYGDERNHNGKKKHKKEIKQIA